MVFFGVAASVPDVTLDPCPKGRDAGLLEPQKPLKRTTV